MDESSTSLASRAGLILTTLEGIELEYVVRLRFKATNNEDEYEALIAGLRIARKLGADDVIVNSNSRLVIGQVLGEYEAKEDRMKEYLKVAKRLVDNFQIFKFKHIPRHQNKQADRLT